MGELDILVIITIIRYGCRYINVINVTINLYKNMEEKKPTKSVIGLFLKYNDGTMINIQDLNKPEYEDFLETMNQLRMVYITITNRGGKQNEKENGY